MDLVFAVALQILYGITNLALISLGLAVIFGMMRVINLCLLYTSPSPRDRG